MKIRYLHLSDIHLGFTEKKDSKWAVDAFNQDIVSSSMIETINRLTESEGNFDFI